MNYAICTALYGPDMRYVDLINKQAKSINTKADYFVILGNDAEKAKYKINAPCKLEITLRSTRQKIRQGDGTKIHAWRYVEYDKILLVDADCHFNNSVDFLFDEPELGYLPGKYAPINTSRLILKPDLKTYTDLLSIFPNVNYSFNDGRNLQGAIYKYFSNNCNIVHALKNITHISGGSNKFKS